MSRRLYETSIGLMAEQGYDAATQREVARRAGVSVGLLYRYFPSKRSVVLKLYDDLSAEFVTRAERMPRGTWTTRFMHALGASLAVLAPHRAVLAALVPVLVGDPAQGLFSASTAFSRLRVQGVFASAVAGATDSPRPTIAAALGRLLYLAHLAVILWWLLDRSEGQVATAGLVALVRRTLPLAAAALRVPMARKAVTALDALMRQGLLAEA